MAFTQEEIIARVINFVGKPPYIYLYGDIAAETCGHIDYSAPVGQAIKEIKANRVLYPNFPWCLIVGEDGRLETTGMELQNQKRNLIKLFGTTRIAIENNRLVFENRAAVNAICFNKTYKGWKVRNEP